MTAFEQIEALIDSHDVSDHIKRRFAEDCAERAMVRAESNIHAKLARAVSAFNDIRDAARGASWLSARAIAKHAPAVLYYDTFDAEREWQLAHFQRLIVEASAPVDAYKKELEEALFNGL